MRAPAIPCVLALLLGGGALGAPATHVPETKNPYLPLVARLYDSLDYEAALSTLEKAAAWPGNGPRERPWLAMMEGVLQVYVQGDRSEQAALDAFKRALRLDPAAMLPVKGSPRVRQLYAQARQELGAPGPGQPAAPPAAATAPRSEGAGAPLAGSGEQVPGSGIEGRVEPTPKAGRGAVELLVGLRGEVELIGREATPAVTAGLSGPMIGGALTVLVQPHPGLRAEGRLHPLTLGPVRPYLALGATAFATAVGGRAALGLDLRLDRLRLFGDAAFERFFNPGATNASHAILLSLGAGWAF